MAAQISCLSAVIWDQHTKSHTANTVELWNLIRGLDATGSKKNLMS